MQWYRIHLRPHSAWATPLRGDTLFGQLCWTLREVKGQAQLIQALEGYNQGCPFLILSDPFPLGYLPRPAVPASCIGLDKLNARERKAAKKRRWLPADAITGRISIWGQSLVDDNTLLQAATATSSAGNAKSAVTCLQPHNSINRLTNCTGEQEFAPFSTQVCWQNQGLTLELYALVDERMSLPLLHDLLAHIGSFGYGKDATTGLGKFAVEQVTAIAQPGQKQGNSCLTLAPCVPQGQQWLAEGCYYQVFTRFGRHGGNLAYTQHPFKSPLLMADTAALLRFAEPQSSAFVGQGLGGDGSLSKVMPQTMHQGYAPVILVDQED